MKKYALLVISIFLVSVSLAQGYFWKTYNSTNSPMASNLVSALSFDADSGLWVGYGNGGGIDYHSHGTWTNYLPGEYINTIQVDKSGKKWVGTFDGLEIFDGSNWTHYTTSNSGLPNNMVWSIAFDINGDVWMGTYKGLVKFDGTNWQVFDTSNSKLPHNTVYKVLIDSTGKKWVGTDAGLATYFNNSWTIEALGNSSAINDIVNIHGAIFVAQNTALYQHKYGNWVRYLGDNKSIRSLGVDSKDHLWIGTFSDGIVRFNGVSWEISGGSPLYTVSNSDLCNNSMLSFASLKDGEYWAGTLNGLAYFVDSTKAGKQLIKRKITDIRCYGGNDGVISIQTYNLTAPVYNWSNGATTKDISNLTAGTYTVNVTDQSNTTLSDTFTITQPAPLKAFIMVASDSITVSKNITGGTPPYSSYWSPVDPDYLSRLPNGTCTLTVWDDHSCIVSDTVTIFKYHNTVGITENANATCCVSVSPNPNNGIFNIQFTDSQFMNGSVEIFNGLGSVIYAKKFINKITEVDLSMQAKGIYLMKILKDNDLLSLKKIVIQ